MTSISAIVCPATTCSPFSTSRRTSFPGDGELSALIQKKCFEAGLILERGGRNGIVLRLLPSLLISDEELKIFLDKFEQALLAAGVRPA